MFSVLRLTPQQRAIVDHTTGPALVYAVAGAGKTTALIQRVAHLVRRGIFAPDEILATSFNRDANRQIEAALARQPACRGVHVRTLHALGYAAVRLARSRGYLPGMAAEAWRQGAGRGPRTILIAALDAARRQSAPYANRLHSLDFADFLTYVSICKGSLAFAERPEGLPWRARLRMQALPVPAATPWYADLYRLFEEERRRAGLLTFDDMLLTGWEVLARHEDVLVTMRRHARCVLVDEFQDVNRAQAEMLDLLTAPARNYMAVGDDDQTIYEWRGASPDYLHSFKRRYGASVYFLTENFRSSAYQLALANQVIGCNRRRQAKALELTQGFAGEAQVFAAADLDSMAAAVAQRAHACVQAGRRPADIAVLVRVYSQAPKLEAALRGVGLPVRTVQESVQESAQETVRRNEGREAAGRTSGGVTITTVHRAKGLEWPVVILPQCNAGIFPEAHAENLEEERRLFYVALTRARAQLYLYYIQGQPRSPYLDETHHTLVLPEVETVGQALADGPAAWGWQEYIAVAVNTKRLLLQSYVGSWWDAPPAQRRRTAEAVLGFYAALEQRGLFRSLGLARSDIAFWRTLAGHQRAVTPLARPDFEPYYAQVRGR